MSSHTTSTIFVIGGSGAQGMPVVRALVADKKYAVRVLTRDSTSARAQALLALGNVSLVEGSFADEDVLREGFRGCDGAFVNIDGFNTGEKVSGHPARYIDTDIDTYWSGPLKAAADLPAGYNADPGDKSTMSFRDNFTGFWNVWKHGIITRDFALLDEKRPRQGKPLGAGPTRELAQRLSDPQGQRGHEERQAVNGCHAEQPHRVIVVTAHRVR